MNRTTAPRYRFRGLGYLLQTFVFWLMLLALFIGFFGMPYLRIDRGSYYGTYSNGIDRFKLEGEILPLVKLVPVSERYEALHTRLKNILTP